MKCKCYKTFLLCSQVMFDIYKDCLSLPSIKSSLIKDNLYVFHIIIDKYNPFIKINEAFPKSRNSARWCLREKYSAFDCNNFNIDTIQISSKRGEKNNPICLSPSPKYMFYFLHGSEVRVN